MAKAPRRESDIFKIDAITLYNVVKTETPKQILKYLQSQSTILAEGNLILPAVAVIICEATATGCDRLTPLYFFQGKNF